MFTLLNDVFNLMMQNKLRKDIDDTLFEKLLTVLSKCRYKRCSDDQDMLLILDDHIDMYYGKYIMNNRLLKIS